MAVAFKVMFPAGQVSYIAAAGIPYGEILVWVAAAFELWIAYCVITGKCFKHAISLAIPYILFLGIVFHGPQHWAMNKDEFGFFVDHFTFIAGLLFMGAHGPGNTWRMGKKK
jgi:uncharacterized membrane protein YphA (DoxX/SURF4 family)